MIGNWLHHPALTDKFRMNRYFSLVLHKDLSLHTTKMMTGTSSSKRKSGNAGRQGHQFSGLRIESSYRSRAGAIKSSYTRVFIVCYGSSAYSPSLLRTGVQSKSSPMTLRNITWGWHTPIKYYRTFGMRLLHSNSALLTINLLNDIRS
jgi:hypothetical protein